MSTPSADSRSSVIASSRTRDREPRSSPTDPSGTVLRSSRYVRSVMWGRFGERHHHHEYSWSRAVRRSRSTASPRWLMRRRCSSTRSVQLAVAGCSDDRNVAHPHLGAPPVFVVPVPRDCPLETFLERRARVPAQLVTHAGGVTRVAEHLAGPVTEKRDP